MKLDYNFIIFHWSHQPLWNAQSYKFQRKTRLKLIYSEKTTKFCENFTLLLTTVQVNLCQKLLFLHQLTHNMTIDCSLNYRFNTWKFQAQTWGGHIVYRNSEQFMYTTCSEHVLSLQFSCTELVIQWAICRHIVG